MVFSGLGSTLGLAPASATVTTLCTGYSACSKAGMTASGYAGNRDTSWWRMYTGHNCTNYAAYRMVKSGLPNVRPWSGGGNATYWGTEMASITNQTPAVGAVVWWKAGVSPAGSSGHVAYVERVISADEIIVSQDSWGGDFSWARITRLTKGWPSGFIHFNDVPLVNTSPPVITGVPRVGSVLTASPGVWNPGDASVRFQWRSNGVKIAGATAASYLVPVEQEGKQLTVRVTASKLGYPTTSVVTAATPTVQPGVIRSTAPPSVIGSATVDATLTATRGQWNPTPDGVSYQWRADGVPLPGAATNALTIDPTLVGKALSVSVTALKSGYSDVVVTSAATAAVVPGTLTVTKPPTVTGVPKGGETLTLTPVGVAPAAAVTVQWLRSGVPVAGATGSTYRLTTSDLGSRISARVTLTRPGYTGVTTRTPSTPRVKATPRIKVGTEPGVGRLTVTATVTARGVSPVDGVLRIRSRGRLLREVTLRNGGASVTLRRLPPGTWTFRVALPASSTYTHGLVERRVTIR